MKEIPTEVVNSQRASPYSVVVIDGIHLPVYAVGGVNISVGELGTVVFAAAMNNIAASGFPRSASGGSLGLLFNPQVASGSGNIVTIQAFSGSGELAAVALAAQTVSVLAFGQPPG